MTPLFTPFSPAYREGSLEPELFSLIPDTQQLFPLKDHSKEKIESKVANKTVNY